MRSGDHWPAKACTQRIQTICLRHIDHGVPLGKVGSKQKQDEINTHQTPKSGLAEKSMRSQLKEPSVVVKIEKEHIKRKSDKYG